MFHLPRPVTDGCGGAAVRKDENSFNQYFREVIAIKPKNPNARLAKMMMWPDDEPNSTGRISLIASALAINVSED